MSANRLVRAAPICAAGPSLPTDPPNARVTTVALSLTGATSQSTRPARWCTAAMTASVPWPRASAAKVRMIQTQSGSATGRKMKTGTRPGVSARAQSAERARAQRKTRVPRPTQTPGARAEHRPFERADEQCRMLGVPASLVGETRRLVSRKTLPRSRSQPCSKTGGHPLCQAYPINDFPLQNASRCEPVNVAVCQWFWGDLTQFLYSSFFTYDRSHRVWFSAHSSAS